MRLITPGDNGDKNDVVTGYGRSLFKDSSELTDLPGIVRSPSQLPVPEFPPVWGGS